MDFFSSKIAYANRFDDFLKNVNAEIVTPLIGFIFAVAVAYFLYGAFEFIANGENEEKKTAGKSHMLWGVVGITIMMGVWGLLSIIINTFGIKGIEPEEGRVDLPKYTQPSSR